jgi:hypothetical protein
MINFIGRFLDDILLVAGCIAILVGLAQWNLVITWVVGGLMLIGWGVLIGKVKSHDIK